MIEEELSGKLINPPFGKKLFAESNTENYHKSFHWSARAVRTYRIGKYWLGLKGLNMINYQKKTFVSSFLMFFGIYRHK